MEIKNCSIYPRYEESLPKMSRIPEFALFMYHRHGKSNRVKCLPHSNGQALKVEVPGERIPRLGYGVVGPQVHFFILDGSPESLHEHIVPPGASAVHADGDGVAGQQAGERRAGELAALIGVEDLRLTVTSQGLLDCFDAELHRDRQPPGQDPPAEPVDHGGEVDEATCHGNI